MLVTYSDRLENFWQDREILELILGTLIDILISVVPTPGYLSCLIFGYIRYKRVKNDQKNTDMVVRYTERPSYISYFDPIVESLTY